MADRSSSRCSEYGAGRPAEACSSDQSMVSDCSTTQKYCKFLNYVDESLTPELTQKTVSDFGKLCAPTASPSYTVLEGRTELLLDADKSEFEYTRPVTVALAPNSLAENTTHSSWDHHRPLEHIGRREFSKPCKYPQNPAIGRKDPRPAQLCQVERRKKSQMILRDLREDGFLVGKGGLSFTIHFCDDKSNVSPSTNNLPPLHKVNADRVYRETMRTQREQVDRRAHVIIDRPNQCVHKRERILERLMSHRVSSSTERNVEQKVDKSIRLEDKKRRKAAMEARKHNDASQIRASHERLAQEHEKLVQQQASFKRSASRKGPIASGRIRSSKQTKEGKGKRN